jgi:hypothetical protein
MHHSTFEHGSIDDLLAAVGREPDWRSVDPESMIQARKAGASVEEIHERACAGSRTTTLA